MLTKQPESQSYSDLKTIYPTGLTQKVNPINLINVYLDN